LYVDKVDDLAGVLKRCKLGGKHHRSMPCVPVALFQLSSG
jgi:hypothetical protein